MSDLSSGEDAPRVHVGVGFVDEATVLALAIEAERLGFDGVTMPDHVFLPTTESGRYPYSDDGRPPFRPQTPWPDQLVMAGAIAASTTRVRITTSILVLPVRQPLLVAKAASTAARLSGGRLSLGIGVGWLPDEFAALGVAFERRGALMDEAIEAIRALWQPGITRHAGAGFDFGPLLMEPKPPAIPLIIGGISDMAVRRAATVGDGWFLPEMPLADVPGHLDRLRAALARAGRDETDLRVFATCMKASPAEVAEIADDLLTDVVVVPWADPGQTDTPLEHKLEAMADWAAGRGDDGQRS
jgi:probable F420-dependent oxidoreductase